jgi:sugar (pentulose or hexulose) kinase
VKQIIVSGGILHSPASLRILADCLGRDIHISRELESSLRGAAIYASQQLGGKPKPLAAGRVVRYDRALAAKHRERRSQQEALGQLLQSAAAATPLPAHRSPRRARKQSSD